MTEGKNKSGEEKKNELKEREISGFRFKEGVLDEKTRHLVGLVASILAGCES